jgi:hypothetical protein
MIPNIALAFTMTSLSGDQALSKQMSWIILLFSFPPNKEIGELSLLLTEVPQFPVDSFQPTPSDLPRF